MTNRKFMDKVDGLEKSLAFRIGRVFGGYRLKPYERRIIEALGEALPAEAGKMLSRQMVHFNEFSHWYRSQAVAFSRCGLWGHKSLPEDCRLAFRDVLSVPVASAIVKSKDSSEDQLLRIDLYVQDGFYSEIMFDRKPREVFGSRNPQPDEIEVSNVDILFDPMNPEPFPSSPMADTDNLPEWVRALIGERTTVTMRSPLEASLRARVLDFYDLEFPRDYVELVSRFELLRCAHYFEIMGPSRLWVYLTPEDYVIKLAEIEGQGALCLVRNSQPGLYYIDNEEHIPVRVGHSFRVALEKGLGDGTRDWKPAEPAGDFSENP